MMNRVAAKFALAALLVVVTGAVAPAQEAAAPASGESLGWPRQFAYDGAEVIAFQPQPESLEGDRLTFRLAVSYKKPPMTEAAYGVVWAATRLDVDRDARVAVAREVDVTRVRFANATPEQEKQFGEFLAGVIESWEEAIDLDQLIASLNMAEREEELLAEIRHEPPTILFSTSPTILVSLDGDPVLRDIENTALQRVANTAFPIVFHESTRTYYLYGTSVWFRTRDVVKGPWEATEQVPREITELFKANEEALKDAEKPEGEPADLRRATIVTATSPTEVIVSDGEPAWAPIGDGEILYMTSSDSDVFLEVASQRYYVLLSGRWFRSASLTGGSWEHVSPPDLPAAFATIPEDSDKGDVLSQVAGTPQAEEAIADSYIPQTSAVSRTDARLEVTYDGEPQFEEVTGTDVAYALNSSSQVMLIKGRYYACEQGVWYVASGPKGPWQVSDERPAEIDQVPPSSPVYNTKYVYVYDSTPDVVYVGYLPGYMWSYPYYGTVIYGTGWYYRPWIGPHYYYPRAWTWGFNVHYSPWTGWGFGMSWSHGWMHFSYGWAGGGWYGGGWYGGWHAGYRAGWNAGYWAGWHAGNNGWGPGGYRPRPGYGGGAVGRPGGVAGARPTPYNNLYGTPRNAARQASPAQVAAARPALPRATVPATRSLAGTSNNVFADRDGNVYRRDAQGGWERNTAAGWDRAPDAGLSNRPTVRPSTPTTRPSTPTARPTSSRPTTQSRPATLNNDYASRQRGSARVQSRSMPRGGGGARRR